MVDSEEEFHHICCMALNIKNKEAERLVAEVASLAGTTRTQAVISALTLKRAALMHQDRVSRRKRLARRLLEEEIWTLPVVDDATPEEEILGYDDM